MPQTRRGILVMAAIVLLLPAQLAVQRLTGGEPYPALYMPSFGSVPVDGAEVAATRIKLTATTDTGDVDVDPVKLMPNDTRLAESIAGFFFADEGSVRDSAKSGWLSHRLADLGVQASQLRVVRERLLINPKNQEQTGSEILSDYVVELK